MLRLRLDLRAAIVSALCCACPSDDDGGADGTDESASDISPESGVWDYVETGLANSTCGSVVTGANDDGPFVVENHGDGTLTVNPQDGTIAFDCTFTGDGAFTCPDRAVADIPIMGYMATASVHATVDGTFTDDTHGMGTQHLTVTCEGSDCMLIVTALGLENPCTADVDFTMSLSG